MASISHGRLWIGDHLLLLKLKLRHLRTALNFILGGIVGADLVEERDAGERLYQAYAVGALALSAALLWVALLDWAASTFIILGADVAVLVFRMAVLAFPLVFIWAGTKYLRNCPITLSPADIAYVAASPLKAYSLVLHALVPQTAGTCLLGFLAGYLLGTCLQFGAGMGNVSLASALLSMLMVAASLLGGWVVGILRLSSHKQRTSPLAQKPCDSRPTSLPFTKGLSSPSQRILPLMQVPSNRSQRTLPLMLGTAASMLAVLAAAFLLVLGGFVGDASTDASFIEGIIIDGFPLLLGVLLVFIAIELAVIKARSANICMTKVAEENALYAELYALRYMPLFELNGYNELRRRRKLAARRPVARLPLKSGSSALLTRSVLSHLRQPDGLLRLLFWGAFVAPTAVYLLSGTAPPVFWLLWMVIVIAAPTGAREATRVFRDDVRNKMMRRHLPFSTLKLLAFDAAPPFAVLSLASTIVILLTQPASPLMAWWLIIGLLVNASFVLCSSLEGLRLAATMRPMGYEAAAFSCALALFLSSLAGIPALVALALSACIAFLALLVRSCKE